MKNNVLTLKAQNFVLGGKEKVVGLIEAKDKFMYKNETLQECQVKTTAAKELTQNKIKDNIVKIESLQKEKKEILEQKKASKAQREREAEKNLEEALKARGKNPQDINYDMAAETKSIFSRIKTKASNALVKTKEYLREDEDSEIEVVSELSNVAEELVDKIYTNPVFEITQEQLRDQNDQQFKNAQSGATLLNRNLKSSKLSIDDDGDMLRVQLIVQLAAQGDSVPVMFVTKRQNFVINYKFTF